MGKYTDIPPCSSIPHNYDLRSLVCQCIEKRDQKGSCKRRRDLWGFARQWFQGKAYWSCLQVGKREEAIYYAFLLITKSCPSVGVTRNTAQSSVLHDTDVYAFDQYHFLTLPFLTCFRERIFIKRLEEKGVDTHTHSFYCYASDNSHHCKQLIKSPFTLTLSWSISMMTMTTISCKVAKAWAFGCSRQWVKCFLLLVCI